MRSRYLPFLVFTGFLLASCGSYRQNILFQVAPDEIQNRTAEAETNYRVQPNDLLTLRLYTNRGERIVDPNSESFSEVPAVTMDSPDLQYLVRPNGVVEFPLIHAVKIGGLTIAEAEEILAKAYEEYYEGAYVVLRFTNKRVIVLGAPGGQVIPLSNENMRLAEVLALAEGVTPDASGQNIRVIRGDEVFVADFSTFEGYRQGNLIVRPGDIVYVEPVRRPFIEALRDYSPAITIVTSLATLIFIIAQAN